MAVKNKDKIAELRKSYEGSSGAAKEMATIMDDNLNGAMVKLGSAWEGFKIGLGESLAPVGHGLIKGFQYAISTVKILQRAFQAGALPGLLKDGFILAGKVLINRLVSGFRGVLAMIGTYFSHLPKLMMANFKMLTDPSFWGGLGMLAMGLGAKLGAAVMTLLEPLLKVIPGVDGKMIGNMHKNADNMMARGARAIADSQAKEYGRALITMMKDAGQAFANEQRADRNVLDESIERKKMAKVWTDLRKGMAAEAEARKKQVEEMKKAAVTKKPPPEAPKSEDVKNVVRGLVGDGARGLVSSLARVGGAALGGQQVNMDKERNTLLKSIERNTRNKGRAVYG